MRITAILAALGLGFSASSSYAQIVQFAGTGTGAIPDAPAGTPNCGVNNLGQPRVVSFDVQGLQFPLVALAVSMDLTHTWRGDLVVKLAAPGGTPSKIIFSHTGSNVPNGCGHNGKLAGVYRFDDSTAAANWWFAAFPTVPPGTYFASAPGGQDPGGAAIPLSTDFKNLAPELANGTWTLTFWDAGDPTPGQPGSGTGSVNAATLFIDQTDLIFRAGFETPPTPTP